MVQGRHVHEVIESEFHTGSGRGAKRCRAGSFSGTAVSNVELLYSNRPEAGLCYIN